MASLASAQVVPMDSAPALPASPPRSVDRTLFLSTSPPPQWAVLLDVSSVAESAQNVLIIQHSDRVPPAFVAFFLREQHVPFVVLALDRPGAVLPPPSKPWKAIVSLGGPQGAYEEAEHPWIAQEKRFLVDHIAHKTPILAICLGAQMLAHALGGKAYAAPPTAFEVGYPVVRLTDAGTKDEPIAELFERLQRGPQVAPASASADASASSVSSVGASTSSVSPSTPATRGFLMHHGDTFDLPSGVECLAVSDAGFKQLYRAGSALAVQFHPEASVHEIQTWTQWNPKRYEVLGTTAENIVQQVKQQQAASFAHSEAFFETWWTKIAGFPLKQQQKQSQQ